MQFLLIFLSICCYILSQTTVNGRTTGLRKAYWAFQNNDDYQEDLHGQKSNRRRQAGWGKRSDGMSEDDYDDIPPYHPYISHGNMAHNWFDDT